MAVDPQSPSVISFGAAEGEPDRQPARRAFLRGLLDDQRLPVLTAALGAVAAFGSLVSEWQTTTMDGLTLGSENLSEERIVLGTLIDLGGAGGGYVAGLLLLAVAVVLTLFGPPAGRPFTRLAGFAVGGVLLALVLALVQHLSRVSVLIPQHYPLDMAPLRVALGRGLWCALAAVSAALIALWRPTGTTARKPARADETPDEDPLDLSITPTTPFASVPGELDQPHRS
ncbi:hypothetical protein QLQ12_11195 [Actinoplanes sp. NEAU-A12]|uniref:Uncharacterized protein n=1 Tax=Actinoplanes sandaracinus TaxID=3045177 RepID=A0ABT6WHF7_9ACTN|nr:hypothetical protein [Actinoplanes sandaracinus]MDI6099163.1 hypothetical protein [Actinoplanes sandaracinus]